MALIANLITLIALLNTIPFTFYNGISYSCILLEIEGLEQNLCKTMKPCKHYASCKMDEKGFFTKCVCNEECHISEFKFALENLDLKITLNYSLNELFVKKICGSDGEDYENFCELRKQSCKTQKDISIYQFGKCGKFCFNVYILIHTVL